LQNVLPILLFSYEEFLKLFVLPIISFNLILVNNILKEKK